MTSSWEAYFLAQVGAAAALTGLVFVALSINLGRIMQYPLLVGRAGEAVVMLVQPVLVGLAALAPYESLRTKGVLVIVPALACWILVSKVALTRTPADNDQPKWQVLARVVLAELALLPPIAGAIMLLAAQSGGLGLVALGAALCIVVGILDAWILLVEILR